MELKYEELRRRKVEREEYCLLHFLLHTTCKVVITKTREGEIGTRLISNIETLRDEEDGTTTGLSPFEQQNIEDKLEACRAKQTKHILKA